MHRTWVWLCFVVPRNITKDHSNWGLRYNKKVLYVPSFTNPVWSYLLCPPEKVQRYTGRGRSTIDCCFGFALNTRDWTLLRWGNEIVNIRNGYQSLVRANAPPSLLFTVLHVLITINDGPSNGPNQTRYDIPGGTFGVLRHITCLLPRVGVYNNRYTRTTQCIDMGYPCSIFPR